MVINGCSSIQNGRLSPGVEESNVCPVTTVNDPQTNKSEYTQQTAFIVAFPAEGQ